MMRKCFVFSKSLLNRSSMDFLNFFYVFYIFACNVKIAVKKRWKNDVICTCYESFLYMQYESCNMCDVSRKERRKKRKIFFFFVERIYLYLKIKKLER